ncbi:hypothetical protein [Sphaerisporangium sp. TRM90804]|uniref:hypothetical protein n=1 Tax=Sphaerisporangium sp. TRM90804 TaxID=3031113 RepID=UPI00244996F6|nr:hypothetical protein [Sphaerisporangium sp. TRM90804]MDH2426598.1 hypothetical protein [Sphaerisporangium sp. TRM90804]
MSHTIGWWDRVRIERLVWTLDQRLYDLPTRSRVAIRREVRANLLEAAADVGTTEALRRVGGSGQLAQRYLVAQLGEGPRHSWVAAFWFGSLTPFVLNFVFGEAADAYRQGVLAVDPHADGTFVWPGVSYLQTPTTFTFADGYATQLTGTWTVLTYLLWIGGTIVVGRLWRLLTSRIRRPDSVTHTV